MAHFKAPPAMVFGAVAKTSTGKLQNFVLREQVKSAQAIEWQLAASSHFFQPPSGDRSLEVTRLLAAPAVFDYDRRVAASHPRM